MSRIADVFFNLRQWRNRVSDNLWRRLITIVSGSLSDGDDLAGNELVVDVSRGDVEGLISDEGTPLSAESFNNLESRIYAAFEKVGIYVDELNDEQREYIDGMASTLRAEIATAVSNAKVFVRSASITSASWTAGSGYYQKTTGQAVPSGYDSTYIGLIMQDDATATNLSNSTFVRAVAVNGTVFLRVGAVPGGTINMGLAFYQTRTS